MHALLVQHLYFRCWFFGDPCVMEHATVRRRNRIRTKRRYLKISDDAGLMPTRNTALFISDCSSKKGNEAMDLRLWFVPAEHPWEQTVRQACLDLHWLSHNGLENPGSFRWGGEIHRPGMRKSWRTLHCARGGWFFCLADRFPPEIEVHTAETGPSTTMVQNRSPTCALVCLARNWTGRGVWSSHEWSWPRRPWILSNMEAECVSV